MAQAPTYSGPEIPGVQLLPQRDAEGRPTHGHARVDGETLRGQAAIEAVRARTDDPVAQAWAAMLLVDPDPAVAGQAPWMSAGDQPQRAPDQQAKARAPHFAGDSLVYWRWHGRSADLVRCTLANGEATPTCMLASQVGAAPVSDADALRSQLGSAVIADRAGAVRQLARAGDSAAGPMVLDVALNDTHFSVREEAVRALAALDAPDRTRQLGRILLLDAAPGVRRQAAEVLGQLGDAAATPDLTKAAEADQDENVRRAASAALARLKGP
jgi:hypothetical protein